MSLYIRRGNTVYLRIIPLISEKEYVLAEGDKVIFTVRRGAKIYNEDGTEYTV